MNSHFFALLSRMRYIRRWGLMDNSYEENLQEHCMMTAAIAHLLAVVRNEKFGGHVDPDAIAIRGLYHDLSEVITGDLPTPIKYYDPAIKDAYKKVEEIAVDQLIGKLPEDLKDTYQPILYENEWDQDTRELVKAADKMSAYLKCVEEIRAGNGDFKKAKEQTLAALQNMQLPEVDYFLEVFAPSFALTLDEQR